MIITDEMRQQWAEQEARWEAESKQIANAMLAAGSIKAIAALIAEYWSDENMSLSERYCRIWELKIAARKLDPALTDNDLYELASRLTEGAR